MTPRPKNNAIFPKKPSGAPPSNRTYGGGSYGGPNPRARTQPVRTPPAPAPGRPPMPVPGTSSGRQPITPGTPRTQPFRPGGAATGGRSALIEQLRKRFAGQAPRRPPAVRTHR